MISTDQVSEKEDICVEDISVPNNIVPIARLARMGISKVSDAKPFLPGSLRQVLPLTFRMLV